MHAHADHLSGAPYIKLKTGAKVSIGEHIRDVPDHTPACVSYKIGDAVFVGDTMFMPDYGTARADFPGGDAHALFRSIQRILSLSMCMKV
jgi:glyoxylase-like metal-dependent hydrolase (beta-lactamase superfamily II)